MRTGGASWRSTASGGPGGRLCWDGTCVHAGTIRMARPRRRQPQLEYGCRERRDPIRRRGRRTACLRIAIDARKLHDFGIGTYIRNVLRGLSRIDHDTEYVLLCQEEDCPLASSLGENFRAVVDTSRPSSFREHLSIPWALRRERVDVFHAPHYVLPPLSRRKSVVTIHDCI